MLGAFMRHGVTRKQCQTEIPFQIIAGSDTTATAIRGTMLYLATTRQAYDRLQREIDAGIADGRISSPIRADQGRKLPYLQVRKPVSSWGCIFGIIAFGSKSVYLTDTLFKGCYL